MENFALGVNASMYMLSDFIHLIIRFQLIWGFVLGFGVAMLMYAFLSAAPIHESASQNDVIRQSGAVTPYRKASWYEIAVLLSKTLIYLIVLAFLVLALLSTVLF